MDFRGKKVAVLDTIHGGETICHKLRQAGADAVAINIYKDPPAAPVIDSFDLVISPVHAQSPLKTRAATLGIPLLSHHQVVGQLAARSKALHDALVFEITGVRGKTTTAALLKTAFSDQALLSLTSSGLEVQQDGRYIAKKRLSITPANILVALDLIDEFDFTPQTCIFETSLGGTGIADVNILTSLSPEYAIAQHTGTSTDAKLQMISNAKANSCLITPSSVASLARPGSCRNTFGGAGATVYYGQMGTSEIDIRYDNLQRISGDRASGEIRFKPSGCYDLLSYQDSLLCFAAAALTSNIDPELIERKLCSFKGVIGRMSVALVKRRILVDNSNSGLQESSIERAVDFGLAFKRPGHRVVLVIGEEAKNICDGIMPEVVASIAGNNALDEVVLVGDRMRTPKARGIHSDDLESALKAALNLTSEHDVIISCVKMWR